MAGTFEFLSEYRNIYENAIYTEKLQEGASTRLELESLENQMRKTAESIVNKLIKEKKLDLPENTDFRGKIDFLHEKGIIDRDSKDNFHTIRMAGNKGSHDKGTMDQHAEERLLKEQTERDINAYKRLYVECRRFADDYMPKINISADRQINLGVIDTTSPKAGSSVSYGTVSTGNHSIWEEEKLSFGYKHPIVLGLICFLSEMIWIFFVVKELSEMNLPDVLIILIAIMGPVIIEVIYFYSFTSYRRGIIKFDSHTIHINQRIPSWESPIAIDVDGNAVNNQLVKPIKKNGRRYLCFFEYESVDGYKLAVYYVFAVSKINRSDGRGVQIFLNGEQVVDESIIDQAKLDELVKRHHQ